MGGIRRAQPKDSVGWRIPQESLATLRARHIAIDRRVIGSGIDHTVLVTSPEAAVPHSRECRPGAHRPTKTSTVGGAPAFNVGRAYAAFAADTENGKHTVPDFADTVRRHEVIAAIEKSAASEKRVKA